MSRLEDPQGLRDLGVLLVHGIGQAAQSSTLLRFGEPLRACVEAIAMPAAGAFNAAGNPTPHVAATVVASRLFPQSSAGPAHVELEISGLKPPFTAPAGAAAGECRWLLAEAWWAKKFPTPTFGEIAAWSFQVLPATLIGHCDRRFRRIGFRVSRAFGGARPLGQRRWRLLIRWLAEGMWVTAMLALSPLLLIAISAMILLGVIPFAPIRNLAGAVQRILAATIGDSFVLMQRPFTGEAICQSVRDDLAWLAARCRRVVVVAHSQGAAIAHRVLREPVTVPCDLLITLGSGLAKLADIENRVTKDKSNRLLWLATGGAMFATASLVVYAVFALRGTGFAWALLTTFAMMFIVVEIGAVFVMLDLMRFDATPAGNQQQDSPPAWGWSALFVFLALAVLAVLNTLNGDLPRSWPMLLASTTFTMGLAVAYNALRAWHAASGRSMNAQKQAALDRKLYRDRFLFHNRGNLPWYDFYAGADPVPNGQLLDNFVPRDKNSLYASEISNTQSFVLDHTAYWDNEDEFVPRVTRLLLQYAGLESRPASPSRTADRRRWRTDWRKFGRWTLALTALALAVGWLMQPPGVIEDLARRLVSLATEGVHPDKPPHDIVPHWSLPLVIVATLWAIATGIALLVWRWWNRVEVGLSLEDANYEMAPASFRWFVLVLLAWTAAGVWVLFGWPGLAAFVAVVALCGAALRSTCLRDRVVLRSNCGAPNRWRQLRLDQLRRASEPAFEHNDARELTWLGGAVRWLDEGLAVRAWSKAADLGWANAALELGHFYRGVERSAATDAEKAKAWLNAVAAYNHGASLDDPESAWWLAFSYDKMEQPGLALDAYRLAFKLGDVGAAHSLGLMLEDQGHVDEALKIYEEGARRGDSLSAQFHASELMVRFRSAQGRDPEEADRLRPQALALYWKAFDLGDVKATRDAGELYRLSGDIGRARSAFASGALLNDAYSSLLLGTLEEEEEQNFDDAKAAYREAIRRDAGGAIAAAAQYRLGALLLTENRPQAAMHRFRAALGEGGTKTGSAEAAIALAALLEQQKFPDADVKAAFLRGMELQPRLAAPPYIAYLDRRRDQNAAATVYAMGVEQLPGDALCQLGKLLRYKDPAAARKSFELALKKQSVDAAVELYEILLANATMDEANSVLDQVLEKGWWYATEVAKAFADKFQSSIAADLTARAEALPTAPGKAGAP